MFKYLASLVGIVFLIAGVALLVLAVAPGASTSTEVGGAVISQEQVAQDSFGSTYTAQNLPDLPVVVDGVEATTNGIAAQPQLGEQALADVSIVASEETAPALSTDLTLQENAEISVVPLQIADAASVANISGQGGAGSVGRVEQRTIELEWTDSIKVGGSGNVRMTLKVLSGGQVVPEINGNAILSTPLLISDFYDTHNAIFSARLTAPDAAKTEQLTSSTQILSRGDNGTWRWKVDAPKNSGELVMILTLELLWEPKPGLGGVAIPNRTIWSQAVKADVNYIFGSVTVPQASMIGAALSFVGAVSQLPMTGVVLTYLFTRRSRTTKRTTRRR